MPNKLTLYIDDDVISHVKAYAKENRLSVSKVVNNFLTILKQGMQGDAPPSTPLTDSLCGVLKGEDIDEDAYLRHLDEKYL